MIEFVNNENKHIVGFRFENKITADDIEIIAAVLEARLISNEVVNLYIEIGDTVSGTFESIIENSKKKVRALFPYLSRIQKAAFVIDENRLQTSANIKNNNFSIEMRSFPFAEITNARDWVNSVKTEVKMF